MTMASSQGSDTYLAGRFWNKLDSDAGELPSAGHSDAFVAKLGAGDQTAWVVHRGGEWDQGVDELALSDGGDLIMRTRLVTSSEPGSGSIVVSRWPVVLH